LPGAAPDPTGQFTIAEVDVKSFISAGNPSENIVIRPHDVITVPRAEMVYVVGAVRRPGSIALAERTTIPVLQALALAEGSTENASNQARILRPGPDGERKEIEVDLKKMLDGKTTNSIALQPEDILFIPESGSKRTATRILDATISTLSGIVIWRGF
jgi:polysaccharide export outer membrane protein